MAAAGILAILISYPALRGFFFADTHAGERRIHEDAVWYGAAVGSCARSLIQRVADNAGVIQRDICELQAAHDVAHRPDMIHGSF